MKVSIIIPVYNEISTIEEIVNKVIDVPLNLDKEIIIIDDASNDGTRDLLRNDIEKKVDKIIYHEKNMGKGAALKSGFAIAKGDIVIIQDADLEFNPYEYPKLIKPIIDGKADVVYGSRFMGSGERRVLYFWHTVANKLLTAFSNILTDLNLTDMETCYKAFKKTVLDNLTIEENGFGFEPEITAKIAKLKCRVYEVGISYYGRTYEEGKKITWKDGVRAIWCILRFNLSRSI